MKTIAIAIAIAAAALAVVVAVPVTTNAGPPRYFSTTMIVKGKGQSANAVCPAGWRVVGGGAETSERAKPAAPPFQNSPTPWIEVITSSYPVGQGWHAEAYRSGGQSEGIALPRVYAVCAR